LLGQQLSAASKGLNAGVILNCERINSYSSTCIADTAATPPVVKAVSIFKSKDISHGVNN
jgi:hypothetical protein